ncbi:hypothetical protein GI364_00695 [Alicyclobacillus sp. SO9]|nr:hypothetical protein GI364_00695 [Alicyclobacillus sp. SO9]
MNRKLSIRPPVFYPYNDMQVPQRTCAAYDGCTSEQGKAACIIVHAAWGAIQDSAA